MEKDLKFIMLNLYILSPYKNKIKRFVGWVLL